MTEKYFTRRVIFSHIPKTGGSYIHKLIMQGVGNSIISPHLTADYSKAIVKFSPSYPLLFGHLFKMQYLNKKYEHVTIIREPTERIISFLFFTSNNLNFDNLSLKGKFLVKDVRAYILSEGDVLGDSLREVFNSYSVWFGGNDYNDSQLNLSGALINIQNYSMFGLYDEFEQFIKNLSNFLGIDYKEMPRVNVTKNKLGEKNLSKKLIKNIKLHNEFDFTFYKKAKEIYLEKKDYFASLDAKKVLPLNNFKEQTSLRNFIGSNLKTVEIEFLNSANKDLIFGDVLDIQILCFFNTFVNKLNFGMHIHDENESLVFGTNSKIKKIKFKGDSLTYKIGIKMRSYLPSGKYHFGFAIVTDDPLLEKHELFWNDSLFTFNVRHSKSTFKFDLPIDMTIAE